MELVHCGIGLVQQVYSSNLFLSIPGVDCASAGKVGHTWIIKSLIKQSGVITQRNQHSYEHTYMSLVVKFDALVQASDIQIERWQVVFLCWMQDLNQDLWNRISSRPNAADKPIELSRIKLKCIHTYVRTYVRTCMHACMVTGCLPLPNAGFEAGKSGVPNH